MTTEYYLVISAALKSLTFDMAVASGSLALVVRNRNNAWMSVCEAMMRTSGSLMDVG